MTTAPPPRIAAPEIGIVRIVVGALVICVLGYAYVVGFGSGGANPFDYFGYFTNQTSLLAGVILLATGARTATGRSVPVWLVSARAIATACMLVVAVIYNLLVPGTGSAPPWVSVVLHIIFPIVLALDWAFVGDRPSLPWRTLWIVVPYPLLWLTVVLARGATDGWIPYGFLLPERGMPALWAHIFGLVGALIAAGSLIWAGSRLPGSASLERRERRAELV